MLPPMLLLLHSLDNLRSRDNLFNPVKLLLVSLLNLLQVNPLQLNLVNQLLLNLARLLPVNLLNLLLVSPQSLQRASKVKKKANLETRREKNR